jgi:hypothetical protein
LFNLSPSGENRITAFAGYCDQTSAVLARHGEKTRRMRISDRIGREADLPGKTACDKGND